MSIIFSLHIIDALGTYRIAKSKQSYIKIWISYIRGHT